MFFKIFPHEPIWFCNLNINNAGVNLSVEEGRPVYPNFIIGRFFRFIGKTLDVRFNRITPKISFSGGYNAPGLCGFFYSKKLTIE